MRPSGARSRSARASSRRTTACSTELHVRAAGTPVAMQIRRRDALCLGESTAESGPRCDEAEEARRRPALTSFVGAKRGRWIPGGFKRRSVAIAPPSFFVDPPGTIRYGFRLVVGGTIPPATYGRWTYPASVRRREFRVRRPSSGRKDTEKGHGLAAGGAAFVDSVHSRPGAHHRIRHRAVTRSTLPDPPMAEHHPARPGLRSRRA